MIFPHIPENVFAMAHQENKKVMEALEKCAAECSHCATACLDEANIKMLTRCIRLDIDCSEICNLSSAFVARGSEHAKHLLAECADVCDDCARECDKHAHMDHCARCAQACRECAEACRAAA
jgi:hypothetical protein